MSTGFYLLDHRQGPDTWYPTRRDPLDVIVVHITAGLEDLDGADASAEQTARYAATTTRKVSWHAGVDSDSFLHLLPASYTAWHCQGFNSESYGVEISKATTRWGGMPPAWVDRTLANTAACLAPIVREHSIPLRRLTRLQVAAGLPGFAAHADLDPERRSDPGADFPWARLFALIAEINNPAPAPAEEDDVNFCYIGQHLIAYSPLGKRRIESSDEVKFWQAKGSLTRDLPNGVEKAETSPALRAVLGRLPWLEPSGIA